MPPKKIPDQPAELTISFAEFTNWIAIITNSTQEAISACDSEDYEGTRVALQDIEGVVEDINAEINVLYPSILSADSEKDNTVDRIKVVTGTKE